MEISSILCSATITILSLGLFVVSLLSYRAYKNSKLLFVSIVFLVFCVKGILFSIGLFYNAFAGFTLTIQSSIFDVFILILLFIATLKR
jgi:hypothetical protein